MAVGYGLEDFLTQPFAKFHHALLMTGGAEVPALTRKSQQIFVTAGFTFHPREAVMEDAAVQKTINHLFHIGPEKPVPGGEPLVIDLLQRLKVVLNALIILRLLWLSGPIDRGCVGQFPSPGNRLKINPTRNTVNLTESKWP
jgi:hypothetical protein